MANELVHTSAGAVLTQAEFEAVGLHVLNSQATGDLIYASSATQLSRLGIGSTNALLTVIGGVPTWQTTLAGLTLTSPTINGTIATTGLTLPAITFGGALTLNGQDFNAGSGSMTISTTGSEVGIILSGSSATHGPALAFRQVYTTPALNSVIGELLFKAWDHAVSPGEDDFGAIRIIHSNIGDGTEETSFYFTAMAAGSPYNTAMTLSGAGALWTDLSVNTLTYKVSGTQVVGARVVDARADDVVDATYGAEEAGVLDALRDAMISHGLIAAA